MTNVEEIQTMIEDCENRQSKMSEWESGFVESLDKTLEQFGRLTINQETKLTEIWDRVTQ